LTLGCDKEIEKMALRNVRLRAPHRAALRFAALTTAMLGAVTACATTGRSASPPTAEATLGNADARAVRAARAAQNRAISALDTAAIASFWTEDVEIRRGLGALIVGRDAYKRLFNPDSGAVARGEELIYQREPSSVVVSATWPLAYEEGTWVGHLGRADGPALIGGRYAAQWVKRGSRWLIRGEVYVALTCAAAGCASSAVP
jgi:ketosteroid isomerase-like protein